MLLLLLLLCSSLTNPFSLLRARKVDFGWGGEGEGRAGEKGLRGREESWKRWEREVFDILRAWPSI